ncbi:MAG: DUF6458 family protein [Streptomycetales bacterium]
MGIGASIFLIAAGAILTYATSIEISGFDLDVVGVILMIVGALGMLAILMISGSRRSSGRRTATVVHEDHVREDHRYSYSQSFSQSFPAGPERVYRAALDAVADLGYQVLEVRPEAGVLTFTGTTSGRSWGALELTATVRGGGDGSTTVTMGRHAMARGGALGGRGGSWGEEKAVAERFLARLADALTVIARTEVHARGDVRADIAAQLAQLSDLRERGALTDDEFQSAKRRLMAS